MAVVPVDLRGSFNALSGQVKQVLAQDPLSGHWFVFTNRRIPLGVALLVKVSSLR